jgi:hypothetical protein
MRRLIVLLLLAPLLPMVAVAGCPRAEFTNVTTSCSCTGQSVPATACRSTTENVSCTNVYPGNYCGSSGAKDCYVSSAQPNCWLGPATSTPANILPNLDNIFLDDTRAESAWADVPTCSVIATHAKTPRWNNLTQPSPLLGRQ